MKAVHFWQLLSAGVENLPYDLLSPETIVAANVGAYAEPMAEHMLAMALAQAAVSNFIVGLKNISRSSS